jgi:hypothetical protein
MAVGSVHSFPDFDDLWLVEVAQKERVLVKAAADVFLVKAVGAGVTVAVIAAVSPSM